MILYGALYSSIAVFLSLWIFEGQASLVMVFLTTMACIPLIYNTIKMEEQKDEEIAEEKSLLKEHAKALEFFLFLFLGMVMAMAFWYIVLDASIVEQLFSVQSSTINRINSPVTGNAVQNALFVQILLNNLQVMMFSLLFAFLYGVGAIFILTWNASVIATAVGNFIRTGIAEAATMLGLAKSAAYFKVFSLGLLKYAIHGIPEIFAYFAAGLAGGIISVAMLKHGLDMDKFKRIIIDTLDIILIALGTVLLAAWLEVYITPLVF